MRIRTFHAVYALGAVAAMAASAASAQTPPDTIPAVAAKDGEVPERVVVTGSRIARADYESDTPLVTFSADTIESKGAVTLETELNTLPQLAAASSSSAANTPNGGQANLDLRGMGTQRTLVLVNGRRMVPSRPDGTVDVNTIPAALVQNIEVITGGASATYGSDAIAGVVNIKLKDHFNGVQFNTQYGVSEEGDGATKGMSLIVGGDFADSRGNGYFTVDWSRRDAVVGVDRDYLKGFAFSTNMDTGSVQLSSSNMPTQAAIDSVFAKYGVANGTVARSSSLLLSTNSDKTLFAVQRAVNFKGATDGPTYIISQVGQKNASAAQVGVVIAAQDFWYAQSPLDRVSLAGHGDYAVNDHLTVYADGLYSQIDTVNQQGMAVLGSSCCAAMTIPASNPFVPADLKTILNSRPTPGAAFTMTEWQTWAGPRVTRSNYDVYQATVGARGDLGLQDLTWDAYYTHGRMDLLETWSGFSSISAANRLLAASEGGQSICTGGFNPFGPVSLSQSCFDYLYRVAHNVTDLVQDTAEVDLQGKVIDLPAGEMRFAAGANYRRNSYRFDVDPIISTGDLSNTPVSYSTRGSVNVSEFYGELLAPILKDLPAVRDLSLDLGYRYSDYNLSGGVSTYKADGNWTIVDGLSIRGGYARATRAPSVGDLFMAISGSQVAIGNSGLTAFNSGDPCDASSAYLNPAANGANVAKVQALCVAQGAPVGFVNIQPRPSITTNGNTGLEPETADTYSIGGVFRPHLDGPFSASLSVDYYDIKVSNTMGAIGAGAILWNCYNASTNPTFDINNPYCQRVSRNPNTGLISNIQNPLLNLGKYHTAGVDVQADLGFDMGRWGRLTANVLVNYLDKFTIQSTSSSPALEYAGTDGNQQVDFFAIAHPKWKASTTLGWKIGDVGANLRWRYIGDMDNAAYVGTTNTGLGVPGINYFDLDASWDITPSLQLRGGVTNLLGQDPPYVDFLPNGADPYTYDLVGRRGFIALKVKL